MNILYNLKLLQHLKQQNLLELTAASGGRTKKSYFINPSVLSNPLRYVGGDTLQSIGSFCLLDAAKSLRGTY